VLGGRVREADAALAAVNPSLACLKGLPNLLLGGDGQSPRLPAENVFWELLATQVNNASSNRNSHSFERLNRILLMCKLSGSGTLAMEVLRGAVEDPALQFVPFLSPGGGCRAQKLRLEKGWGSGGGQSWGIRGCHFSNGSVSLPLLTRTSAATFRRQLARLVPNPLKSGVSPDRIKEFLAGARCREWWCEA